MTTSSFKACPPYRDPAGKSPPPSGKATFKPRKIWNDGRGPREGGCHAHTEMRKRLIPLVNLRFPAPLGRRGLPRRTVLPPRDEALLE